MADKVFVDTNVILQYMFQAAPLYSEAQSLINGLLRADAELWISRQIIREYLAQVSRPQPFLLSPLSADEAEQRLSALLRVVAVADDTASVTKRLLSLLKQYPTGGKQIHDANIVATMLVNDITTLLTRNIEDMRRFEPVITLVPLAVTNPPEAGPDSLEMR